MKVEDPERPAQETERMVIIASVEAGQVEQLLGAVDVSKAIGPDAVSPRLKVLCQGAIRFPLFSLHVLPEGKQVALNMEGSTRGTGPQKKLEV